MNEDEDEREEGEIVDLNDDDIYDIISSDELDEDDLRQRIEELEAKNSELEKIASISKTFDYGLGCGSSNFINLVDDGDDDESYHRQPSKYDYSRYSTTSRKRSRSKKRKSCRHDSKKSKHYKPYKTERRKKIQPNRTRVSSDSSSDDEFQLDRSKLQAALKRNNSSVHSSTLKRKLIGVSKTVEDFIKEKEDVGDEDISTSIEIMHLLNKINIDEIAPKNKASIAEVETESNLNEQELRIIALKSAILKKAEARKKRKLNETQPYSPTDDVVIESNVIGSKNVCVNAKPKDDLDNNMEISPAVSPTNQDDSLLPIDMDLESDDDIREIPIINTQQETVPSIPLSQTIDIRNTDLGDLQNTAIVTVPDELSLSNAKVPEQTNQIELSFDSAQQRKQLEEEEEQALRASLLANLKASKRKAPSNGSQPIEKPNENSLHPEKSTSDASVEMERLRKQAISSMQKRRNQPRHLLPNPFSQKFSVQVPRPMEMTMPQITSNLKEALKRIKERDKQNVDSDTPSNEQSIEAEKIHQNLNAVLESTKEIRAVEIVKSRKVQPDISELKNIAKKLNGGNIPPKTTTSNQTVAVTKPCEPNIKIPEVLKNVTCNNTSVETKTKDVTVPLVMSNKIEAAASLEKSEDVIRSLKSVAQKKVITELHPSLNQKENQQLQRVVVSPKPVSEEKLAIAKKTKINNFKISRVITTPVEKPVKTIIIQLNNSDTESDDLGLEQQSLEDNYKSYSGVASPASCNFSPLSPANLTDNKTTTDTIPSTNDSFQRKLDEYLKTTRTKVEQTKQETKTTKKSSSLVSHLPPSSQLEYRKLINRMALLEKQKLLKLRKSKATAAIPKPNETISVTIANEPNISVTIANDLFNPQPKSIEDIVKVNGNDVGTLKKNEVAVQNEDSAITKECNHLLSVSTVPTAVTTAVTDTAIKSNNQRKSESLVPKQTKQISTKSKEPEKSNNCLQSLSTLSEDEKNVLLQRSEAEYMSHSELYLVDLNNMSLLVNKARQEKEKQFQIETEIEELEMKVQELKKQLVKQKASVSKLYPVISSSHKNIMQKRSKSLQLNKKCYNVGIKIVGADYKIPGDPKADIAHKVKSLSSETKLLRNMTKSTTISEPKPVAQENGLETESVNHTTVFVAATVAIPITTEKPDVVQQSAINCTPDNIPMPCSMIKYRSPLEHMKNIGTTNPDSIVCPFQLLGQCEDKECTYQHLSS